MGELCSAKKLRRLIVYRPPLDRCLPRIVKLIQLFFLFDLRLKTQGEEFLGQYDS